MPRMPTPLTHICWCCVAHHSLERMDGAPAAAAPAVAFFFTPPPSPPPPPEAPPMKCPTMCLRWILPVAVLGSLSVIKMRSGTCTANSKMSREF